MVIQGYWTDPEHCEALGWETDTLSTKEAFRTGASIDINDWEVSLLANIKERAPRVPNGASWSERFTQAVECIKALKKCSETATAAGCIERHRSFASFGMPGMHCNKLAHR